jgi:uncharacterized DUF497 family protein
MIQYNWDNEKNILLKESRNISFEQIIALIEDGNLLDILEHPNKDKYAHQKILIVKVGEYVYAVPFVENKNERFLKTIIPSRKYTKIYLGGQNG